LSSHALSANQKARSDGQLLQRSDFETAPSPEKETFGFVARIACILLPQAIDDDFFAQLKLWTPIRRR